MILKFIIALSFILSAAAYEDQDQILALKRVDLKSWLDVPKLDLN